MPVLQAKTFRRRTALRDIRLRRLLSGGAIVDDADDTQRAGVIDVRLGRLRRNVKLVGRDLGLDLSGAARWLDANAAT